MSQAARLRTYHEQALNAAALIAALATSHLPGDMRLDALKERQDQLLDDLLHDFAYKARKTIELARKVGLPCTQMTERRSLMGVPPSLEGGPDSALYSMSFVLGRIIHSLDLAIERAPVPSEVGGATIYQEAAWAFKVRSDKDQADQGHFIFIEFLVDDYLAFADDVQAYLDRAKKQP